jgi:hypothetical protein
LSPANRFLAVATILVIVAGSGTAPARVPDAPSATADAEPAQSSEPTEQESESEKAPAGRLLITSDAAVTISVNGEELGVLAPEEVLEYEVTRAEGEVRAVSLEASGALLKKPYAFEESTSEAAADAGDSSKGQSSELAEISIHFRMLKAVRQLRKTERQEKIFPDFRSGVMWAREDNRANVTWKAAGEYCSGLDLGGRRDWRLPGIEELDSLQAMWSQAAFKTADPIKLSDCCPWSSTEIDEQKALNFNFRFRKQFEGFKGHSFGMRALCIRNLTDEEIAEHEQALEERERQKKEEKKRKKKDRDGNDESEDQPADPEEPADPLLEPPGDEI